MPLPHEFLKNLPGKSDEQLYDILGHADDYLSEALEAVKEELRRRDLPAETAAKLEAMSQEQSVDERKRAEESLDGIVKLFMFLSSATLIAAMVGLAIMPARYESRGYKKSFFPGYSG